MASNYHIVEAGVVGGGPFPPGLVGTGINSMNQHETVELISDDDVTPLDSSPMKTVVNGVSMPNEPKNLCTSCHRTFCGKFSGSLCIDSQNDSQSKTWLFNLIFA